MSAFAYGNKAFGFCDRCGFRYPLHELKQEVTNLNPTNMLVCPECWDPEQPQNLLGRFPVSDPQALRNPRPPLGLESSRSTDGINLSYDFVKGSTSSHTLGPSTYYGVNNFVYTLNDGPNTSSSVLWDPDGFYVTLGQVTPASSGNKYQILARNNSYGGSSAVVSIDTSKYKELQVRIRKAVNVTNITKAWNGYPGFGGSFWFDTGDGSYTSGSSVTPEPDWNEGIGGWNILKYNLSNNTKWTGASEVVGFQFRFYGYVDPGIGASLDSYDLSWIKFIPY